MILILIPFEGGPKDYFRCKTIRNSENFEFLKIQLDVIIRTLINLCINKSINRFANFV